MAATAITVTPLYDGAANKGNHRTIVKITWGPYVTSGHIIPYKGSNYNLGNVRAVKVAGGNGVVATYDHAVNTEPMSTTDPEMAVMLFVRASGAQCANAVDLAGATTILEVLSY